MARAMQREVPPVSATKPLKPWGCLNTEHSLCYFT